MSDLLDFKSVLVYSIIVIVVALGVAYALSSQLKYTYSISTTLLSNGTHTVYPFQKSGFKLYINNTGSKSVTSLPLLIYINGNPFGNYKVTLPAGKGGAIYWNYTYPANGTYTFEVIADPGHLFDIQNRSLAQASVTVNVSAQQSPEVYTSVPNNGISGTDTFAIFRNGSSALANIALGYNISVVNQMLGPAHSIVLRTLQNLAGTINAGRGAISYYKNGSIAYTTWLQGTLSPGIVAAIVNSFSVPMTSISLNGTPALYAAVSNTVSVCFFYSNGWTKMISYYNNTSSGTCSNIAASAHTDSESALISSGFNSTPRLANLSSNFYYTNSIYLGSAITHLNGSFGAASLFGNQYGTYLSYIKQNVPSVDISRNQTCNGIVYPSGNVFICSSFVAPLYGSGETTALINETVVTSNYTASLYSFVNSSNLRQANENGLRLLLSRNISSRSAGWNTPFRNTCTILNVSISCNVLGFNHTTSFASLRFVNNLGSTIKISSASCAVSGAHQNEALNLSIAQGQSANAILYCYNLPVPVATAQTSYSLSLNYTINGMVQRAYGYVNISNFAV